MKTYKYTDATNTVVHVIDEDGISRMSMLASAIPEGNTPQPANAKTKEQIIEEYQAAVQKRLDEFAQTRNYNGILSACTYATSLVARFKAEGQYCVNVRDTTWSKCYEILDAVNSNSRPLPTLEQLMSELPILSWPN